MPAHKKPLKNFEWSSNLAYAVGLLVTDGNLSSDGRHITMRSKDIEQLNNFKLCLNLRNDIGLNMTRGKKHYRVQFGDIQLYKWLESIGISQNKTHNIGSVLIPDRFCSDFMRGHLDGDGSISVYADSYNAVKYNNPAYVYTRLVTRFVSASHNHIIWLQEYAMKNIGVNGAIHVDRSGAGVGKSPIWVLKYGKKESINLLKSIYYDSDTVCLSRKRDIASNFIKP